MSTQKLLWDKIKEAAAKNFGVKQFRFGQEELIHAVLTNKSALGILVTAA